MSQPDDLGIQIGNNLRAARKRAGWRQEDLAVAMGVSRPSLSNWEKGRMPDAGVIVRACLALQVAPSELLNVEVDHSSLVERLRRLFSAEGQDLAEHITSLGPQVWEAVFAGKVFVSTKVVEAIANGYGVSFGWLMTGDHRHWTPNLKMSLSSRMRFVRLASGISVDDSFFTPITSEGAVEGKIHASVPAPITIPADVNRAFERSEQFAIEQEGKGTPSYFADWVELWHVLLGTVTIPRDSAPWGSGDWREWLRTGEPPQGI